MDEDYTLDYMNFGHKDPLGFQSLRAKFNMESINFKNIKPFQEASKRIVELFSADEPS